MDKRVFLAIFLVNILLLSATVYAQPQGNFLSFIRNLWENILGRITGFNTYNETNQTSLTPWCSISASPSSGTGSFSSTITISYANLSTSPGAISVNCGNGSTIVVSCTGTMGSCTTGCVYPSVTSRTSYTVSASASGTACSSATITNDPPIATSTSGNSNLSVQRLFPGQYDNTKYSIIVEDPDGVKEFLIKKADGGSMYGGSPGAAGNVGACSGSTHFVVLTSGTVTLLTTDFPLSGYVIDCKDTAIKYSVQTQMPPLPGEVSVPTCSLSATPTSGTGPFSPTITVKYGNLSTSPGTITVNCGSYLNFGTVTASNCAGTTGSCNATCSYPSVSIFTSAYVEASASGTICSGIYVSINPSSSTNVNQTSTSTASSTNETCVDTDGGNNITVKGTTTYKTCPTCYNNSVTDHCSTNNGKDYVTEGWCANNTRYQASYLCQYGCQDGICLSSSQINQTNQTTNQTCPTCPSPTSWSTCVSNAQWRTNYQCNATSNQCQGYTESQSCTTLSNVTPPVTTPPAETPPVPVVPSVHPPSGGGGGGGGGGGISIPICKAQGAAICSIGETCSEKWLTASDNDRCCSKLCVPIVFNKTEVERKTEELSQTKQQSPQASEISTVLPALELAKENITNPEHINKIEQVAVETLEIVKFVASFENQTKTRGIEYSIRWIFGFVAEQEKRDAQFLEARSDELLTSINKLKSVAEDLEDVNAKNIILEESEKLQMQANELSQGAKQKRENARGILSWIGNFFGQIF